MSTPPYLTDEQFNQVKAAVIEALTRELGRHLPLLLENMSRTGLAGIIRQEVNSAIETAAVNACRELVSEVE